MKKSNTSKRLKEIMNSRNLKQIDILKMCEPYCVKYEVKMNKSDLSQYVSGKNEPNQDKLVVLSKALGVSESWLMGFDDSYPSIVSSSHDLAVTLDQREYNLICEFRKLPIDAQDDIIFFTNSLRKRLTSYFSMVKDFHEVNAAHEIPGASAADKKHDDDIMDDDNF